LSYNPKTGNIKWTQNRCQFATKGQEAGCLMTNGYISISLSGGRFYAHRIAFLISNKYMPKYIDHINSIKTDNRLSNLRGVYFF